MNRCHNILTEQYNFTIRTASYKFHLVKDGIMKFRVVLEEAEEGGYVVYVPALPGCVSQGETKEEALENIKEAIEVYLDVDEAEIEAEIKGKKAEIIEITL